MNYFLIFAAILGTAFADDVLVLTDSNFVAETEKVPIMLVEFYAPWCGHCKRLAPEYEVAATSLKYNDPPVPLAKVDCTAETTTCSKYGVSGYPTLKIFKLGEVSEDYNGPRESAGIIKTMKKKAGPVATKLDSVEKVNAFLSKDTIAVVGFFSAEDSSDAKNFIKVADKLGDLRFGYTVSEDVRKALKRDENAVILFRPKILQSKFEDNEVAFTGAGVPKLKDFLESESLGLCAERNQDNAGNFGTPTFVAYYDVDYKLNPKGTNYWRNRVMKVGKKLRDEGETVHFGISDKGVMGGEMGECGLDTEKAEGKPLVCAFNEKKQKFQMTEEFSMDTFEKFVRDVLSGAVEPYMKSEPVPEPNDAPVKVVVAKNFEEIVNNEDKDVLIEFYAPWCGHCKSLAPKYDELAEKLLDEESITIAKMDATANDVPPAYEVRGFPTIYYAPKGSKNSPKKYEGGREVDDFIKYLAKESTDGLSGFGKDGKKKKKSKKSKTEL